MESSEIHLKSWDKYKSWVDSNVSVNKSFYYRGQRDSEWPLETTFHRETRNGEVSFERYKQFVSTEALYYFNSMLNQSFNLEDKFEYAAFLALLQHHGFPTPLLDWTLSPYIAAYFAYRDLNYKNPQNDSVSIFVFDYGKWEKTFEQPRDLAIETYFISTLTPYAKFNPRLIPQQCVYTVTNVPDMEKHINLCSQRKDLSFLCKIYLDATEKIKVMRDLSLMGITEMTLFQSVDGLCHFLKEKCFTPETIYPMPLFKDLIDSASKK